MPSILVVEDEPAILELIKVNLVDAGYDVKGAEDAETAHAFKVFGGDELHVFEAITELGSLAGGFTFRAYVLLRLLNSVKRHVGRTVSDGMNGYAEAHFRGGAHLLVHYLLR